jgi:hypothetical protein
VNCSQELCIELLSVIKFHRETEPTLIRYNIDYCIYSFVSVTHIQIMIFFDVKIMQFFGVSPSEQY